jgi:fatty-acyl-CoA synthase
MSGENWWSPIGGYAADILSVLAGDEKRVVLRWRDHEVTGRRLLEAVTAAYQALGRLGAGPGSVVAVLVEPNRPDMLVARYAANLRGAAVCYLRTTNPGSNAAELSVADRIRVLEETGATVLYTDEENLARATELTAGVRTRVAVLGPIDLASEVDAEKIGAVEPWDPSRLAAITFTSGSTGRPKGIRVSGRAWEGVVRLQAMPMKDGPVMLLNTPVSHTVGTLVDATITAGGSVVLREDFQAGRFLRDVAEHQVNHTFMGTGHLYQLADHLEAAGRPDPAEAGLSTLRLLTYAGSAAAPARVAQAVRVLGPIVVQSYGTVETGGISALRPDEHLDPTLATSAGQPFPWVAISVRDTESGAEVAAGDTGEVWIRSPFVMDGYFNDPGLSARVLRDGWYATGDIGYLGEKGHLHLLGRIAEVVKVQYTKVHPAVVEQEILTINGVRNAAVYGRRNEDFVESLHCAVVLQPGASVTTEQISAHLRASLSAAHVPQDIVVVDEIPLDGLGKPDKALLRSRARGNDRA